MRPARPFRFASLVLPSAGLALLWSASRPPQEIELSSRVANLEQVLAAETKRLELVEGEHKQLREQVAALLACLRGQAESIAALEGALGRAEAAGFTAGINPKSREELLAGWRAYLSAQKEKLGQLEAKPKAEAGPRLPR